MNPSRVFIGLGSNIGDRARFLNLAAGELARVAGTSVVWFSSVYETEPFGITDQPRFLNAAGEIETTLTPSELLRELKAIEVRVGRTQGDHWGPREIDLDILLYEGVVYRDDAVTVPHPGLEERRFVLVPLREIAPDVVHPVSGMTITELASACPPGGRVVKTSYHLTE